MQRHAQGEVTLVSQPTLTDAAGVGLGFYSSSHARPNRNYRRGDDFTLTRDSTITRIRWWGLSEGRIFDDLRNFNRYTIEIFTGVGTSTPLPGALLWSRTSAPSALSITPTGRTSSESGAAEHVYEAALGTGVELAGGRSYILAISARAIGTSGDAWQWQDGRFSGGHGANYSYASRTWTAFQDTDSAFELFGTSVPGPAASVSLAALAISLSGRGVRVQTTGRTRRA